MKNFIKSGQTKTFTADADYSSGDVVVVGEFIGINAYDVVTGEQGEMALTGVYELAKEAALVINDGDQVYWDTTAKEVDKTGTNAELGIADKDAAGADDVVRVLLKAGPRAMN